MSRFRCSIIVVLLLLVVSACADGSSLTSEELRGSTSSSAPPPTSEEGNPPDTLPGGSELQGDLSTFLADFLVEQMGATLDDDEVECMTDQILEEVDREDVDEALKEGAFDDLPKAFSGPMVASLIDCAGEALQDGIAFVLLDDPSLGATPDQADCIAESYVAILDAETLLEALKLDNFESLPAALQSELVPPLIDCGVFAGVLARNLEVEGGFTPVVAQCIADAFVDQLTDAQLQAVVEGGGTLPPDVSAIVTEISTACQSGGVPTRDEGPGGATPIPFALGDDAVLDELTVDCSVGVLTACDTLYDDSPIDSPYEAFGNTCGNRVPPDEVDGRYCTAIFGTDVLQGE